MPVHDRNQIMVDCFSYRQRLDPIGNVPSAELKAAYCRQQPKSLPRRP